MKSVILIAHNLRSTHNVGSLLRTAEGLGVQKVYLTGYTPYPLTDTDSRLPHESLKLSKQINKTALGAERLICWEQNDDLSEVLKALKSQKYSIIGLEQLPKSIKLHDFKPKGNVALIVGREVEGLEAEVVAQCDEIIEIPMHGEKESFNVVQAAAIALYDILYRG